MDAQIQSVNKHNGRFIMTDDINEYHERSHKKLSKDETAAEIKRMSAESKERTKKLQTEFQKLKTLFPDYFE